MHSLRLGWVGIVLALLIAACGPGVPPTGSPTPPESPGATGAPATGQPTGSPSAEGAITVYSGRSEDLVGPLIEQFEAASGITVNVRYADTAELAVLLLEEGANTRADVFFAQDAGALGAVAQEGMFASLPHTVLEQVPAAFRSPEGQWVGISGRARVIAYDSSDMAEEELPQSIDELTGEEWRGRVGWAPTNGSFQAFVTALRLLRGDDAARQWLTDMLANDPVRYDGNTPIVVAIDAGEIDLGLVNHYYALRQRAEQGEEFTTRNHFLPGGDPGSLINVAGAGILSASQNQQAAQAFLEYMLSADGQRYFTEQTFEYPLVEGVDGPADVPPLAELEQPDIDLSALSDLEGTLDLLHEVGALP